MEICIGWFGIFAGERCFVIPKFYTISDDRPRKKEAKALCQHFVWVLIVNGLSLYCKLLRPIMH